ncbi:hypothetical protein [Lysobacter enzymogenes]|jgi:hypothetical protein|uniref:hypothetical protein n=1 Tax=Lysobacter enzymogenes TaxID=69 RepID=UPI0008992EF0|nr:hypothetical protein [Lysobacter enzymogenes]SDX92805.1 hypothetical protein SAMN05421681_10968 [Lysobacter enzymogenes]
MRLLKYLLLTCLCALALAGCQTTGTQNNRLFEMQYAYSAAIRWGDFEGAGNLIKPELRKKLAPTPIQLERFKQIQVSGYTDVGSETDKKKGSAVRIVNIGVINRHTLAERSVRYVEAWEWDPVAKTWWLISGLPDFWEGQ